MMLWAGQAFNVGDDGTLRQASLLGYLVDRKSLGQQLHGRIVGSSPGPQWSLSLLSSVPTLRFLSRRRAVCPIR